MPTVTEIARKIKNECAGMRIRQASRVLTRIYDESLRSLDIQESQLSVLVAIAIFGENGATMGALAKALVMDRTTLTRNIQPLEKAGWLRVARAPDDARARIIFLTRSGERMLESAAPLWEHAQERVRRALGTKGFDALRMRLSEVVRLADSDHRAFPSQPRTA
jgi:DNA-binding MarR family transcriptional regulator